jgi:hypothetical protein
MNMTFLAAAEQECSSARPRSFVLDGPRGLYRRRSAAHTAACWCARQAA